MYDLYFFTIFYFARRFVPDQHAAEDITTEAFLKLWPRLTNFNSLAAMQSYLHVTARNACLNYLRNVKRKSTQQEQLQYLLQQGSADSFAEQQLQAEVYKQIYEEIEKLSPQLKKIFRMAYIEGLSNEAIAEQLGINNQSVRNDKSRALKQIRMAMMDKGIYGIFLLWFLARKFFH